MSDLIWLPGYEGQTTDELLALEDTHRIDSLTSAFAMGIWKKENAQGTDALTEEEWIVMAIEEWWSEVNNGGFFGFFYNLSVRFSLDIVDALRRIDCPHLAAIAESAIEALELPDLTLDAIQEKIADDDPDRDELLSTCTEQVFEYREPVEERLFAYIKRNSDRIGLPL